MQSLKSSEDLLIAQREKNEEVIADEPSKLVQHAIKHYLKASASYALPAFDDFVMVSDEDRKKDMIAGFPYISKKHPWPKWHTTGVPMQPIFQVNLRSIGAALEKDFGTGLAQVWCRLALGSEQFDSIDIACHEKFEEAIFLRIVSEEDLSDDLLLDWPDGIPAEKKVSVNEEAEVIRFFKPLKQIGVGKFVKWIRAGQMYEYPDGNIPFENFLQGFDEDGASEDDDWDKEDRFRETIKYNFLNPLTAPDIYAGGYGGKNGLDDPALNEEVVVSIMDGGNPSIDQLNVSLVFQPAMWIQPDSKHQGDVTHVHFSNELKLKVLFSMPGKNY